jgi:hypothetical protein
MVNEVLMAAFKKYENFILPIAAVLVAIVLFALFVVPQGLKVPDTNKEIQTSQTSLDALTKKKSILDSVDPNKVQDDLNTALQALPPDADIPGVFSQILLALNANNLTLQNVGASQSSAAPASGLGDFILRLGTEGSADSFSKFIDQTKQIPRVIRVQAFTVGSGGANGVIGQPVASHAPGSGGAVALQIDITIQTYYQSVPATQSISTEQPVSLPSETDEKTLENIRTEISNLPGSNASSQTVPGGKADPFQ